MADDLDDFFDDIEEAEAEVDPTNEDDSDHEGDKVSKKENGEDNNEDDDHKKKVVEVEQQEQQPPPAKRIKSAAYVRPKGAIVAASAASSSSSKKAQQHAPLAPSSSQHYSQQQLPPGPMPMPPLPPGPMPPLPPGEPPQQQLDKRNLPRGGARMDEIAVAAAAAAAQHNKNKNGTSNKNNNNKNKPVVRMAAGQSWVDSSLSEWPANDYRIFVGNLGADVSDDMFYEYFKSRYPSVAMSKIVRDTKKDNQSKGYGFVSFLQPLECAKAMREQDQAWIGSRPVRVKRSDWQDRNRNTVQKKQKKERQQQKRYNGRRR